MANETFLIADINSAVSKNGRDVQGAYRVRTSVVRSFNAGSQQTAAIEAENASAIVEALVVQLVATAACWISFGSSPVASAAAGSVLIPAGETVRFRMLSGHKIAAVQDSTSGNLSIAVLN